MNRLRWWLVSGAGIPWSLRIGARVSSTHPTGQRACRRPANFIVGEQFITLRKSEALFSPSTRYRDLALGPSLFHWESQSTTTAASPTGQRYIHHATRGSRVLLFVREQRKQDGRPGAPTEPFVCLGFARYESHEGERPMAIRWRLEREIPAAWLPVMALAV
jgi:hypothetical protein